MMIIRPPEAAPTPIPALAPAVISVLLVGEDGGGEESGDNNDNDADSDIAAEMVKGDSETKIVVTSGAPVLLTIAATNVVVGAEL
jgi:hypothetical protein